MTRVGGIITVKIDSQTYMAKGGFTYSAAKTVKTTVIGSDGVHGYSELPVAGFIAGEFTDNTSMTMDSLTLLTGATVTLDLANGKTIVLKDAWLVDALEGNTEEGNMSVRFESKDAQEIPA